MKTYTICDRGYDCNKRGPAYDCTADSFLDAVRMMDGFLDASYAEPINDVHGCSTYAVYKTVRGENAQSRSKIGVIYVSDTVAH